MIDEPRNPTGSDDRLIDRLVDGELTEVERRELLARLDGEPGGWRRCALAFLESQSWREELRCVAELAPTEVTDVAPAAAGRQRRTLAFRSVLALAATFLLSFAFGWTARGPLEATRHARPERAEGLGEPLALGDRNVVVSEPAEPAALPQARYAMPETDGEVAQTGTSLAAADDSAARSAALERLRLAAEPAGKTAPQPADEPLLPEPPVRTVGRVTWTMLRDGKPQQVTVPVVAGEGITEEWLLSQRPAIRESVRLELERRGHEVVANRQLLKFDLAGGRRLVLPVDQVEVRFANRVYQ